MWGPAPPPQSWVHGVAAVCSKVCLTPQTGARTLLTLSKPFSLMTPATLFPWEFWPCVWPRGRADGKFCIWLWSKCSWIGVVFWEMFLTMQILLLSNLSCDIIPGDRNPFKPKSKGTWRYKQTSRSHCQIRGTWVLRNSNRNRKKFMMSIGLGPAWIPGLICPFRNSKRNSRRHSDQCGGKFIPLRSFQDSRKGSGTPRYTVISHPLAYFSLPNSGRGESRAIDPQKKNQGGCQHKHFWAYGSPLQKKYTFIRQSGPHIHDRFHFNLSFEILL